MQIPNLSTPNNAGEEEWLEAYRQLLGHFLDHELLASCRLKIPHGQKRMTLKPGMHCHLEPELFLQLQGYTRFRLPNQSIMLEPGEICLVPGGVPHGEKVGAYQGQAFGNLVITAHGLMLGIHAAHEQPPGKPRIVRHSSLSISMPDAHLKACLLQLISARLQPGDEYSSTLELSLLTTALTLIVRGLTTYKNHLTTRDEHPKVVQCRQYVAGSFAQSDLNVRKIAEWLHCSADYLSHLFHRQTGTRLSAHINQCRIDHARDLLTATSLNLSEIAWACGYHDPAYFSRIFKALSGQSPRQYRRQQLQADKLAPPAP